MDVFELEQDAPPVPINITGPSRAASPGDERRPPPANEHALEDTLGELSLGDGKSPTQHQRRGSYNHRALEFEIGDALKAKSGKKHASDFEQLKVLGTGAYGKVMLVRDIGTGRLYAQKQLKKASIIIQQRMIDQTMSERQILESVRHPYIVKLHYAIQDAHKLYLLLQYAEGGELFTHLAAERMFSEDCAAFYGAQAACALCHLHRRGIVYRDLKPENCLLDSQGNLLLTDFGLSKIAEGDSTCNSMLGTPEYMAPEVLLGEPYDYTVDWWSFGALLYDFMTGNPPFTGANQQRVINKIVGQKYKPQMPYYLSPDAKDLLRRLLRKEPERRLGYKQFDVIKKHRFFRNIDWAAIEAKSPALEPPITPIIGDPAEAENFSTNFTEMAFSPAANSPGAGNFAGFSYVGSLPSEMR